MATYGSETGVEAITNVTIDANSKPTTAQVTTWLAQAYARINRALSSQGYSVPVASGAAVHDELAHLCDKFAAAHVLRHRGLDTRSGEQENRSDVYMREFRRELKDLATSDLTDSGVSLAPTKRRRRLRSLQVRRIDGYSGAYEGDYEEYEDVSD